MLTEDTEMEESNTPAVKSTTGGNTAPSGSVQPEMKAKPEVYVNAAEVVPPRKNGALGGKPLSGGVLLGMPSKPGNLGFNTNQYYFLYIISYQSAILKILMTNN